MFLVGLIIDALAPSFGAEKNPVQAMKVAVYSWTAAWIAGIFFIIPWVGGLLALAGLYSLYLLYLGLGQVMKSPPDKSVAYTVVVIVLAIVVYAVAAAITGGVMAVGMATSGVLGAPSQLSGGTIHLGNGNGSATIDLGKLQASAQQAEQSIKAAQAGAANGKINAIDPQQLKSAACPTTSAARRAPRSPRPRPGPPASAPPTPRPPTRTAMRTSP